MVLIRQFHRKQGHNECELHCHLLCNLQRDTDAFSPLICKLFPFQELLTLANTPAHSGAGQTPSEEEMPAV